MNGNGVGDMAWIISGGDKEMVCFKRDEVVLLLMVFAAQDHVEGTVFGPSFRTDGRIFGPRGDPRPPNCLPYANPAPITSVD